MSSISEAKRELKFIRTKLLEMNTTQLTNFFKPFSADKLESIKKSLNKAFQTKRKEIITANEKKIAALEEENRVLRG